MFRQFIKMGCPLCGNICSFLVSIDRAVMGEVSITFKTEVACCADCGIEYKPVLEKKILFREYNDPNEGIKSRSGANILFPCPSGCCSKGRVAVFVEAEKAYPRFYSLAEANEREKEAESGMLSIDFVEGATSACDECGKSAQVIGEKLYFQISKLL